MRTKSCLLIFLNFFLITESLPGFLDWFSISNDISDVKAIFSYQNGHGENKYELKYMSNIVYNEHFNKELATIIYIHGYLGHGKFDDSVDALKNAYHEKGNHNFIAIDWSTFARFRIGLPYFDNIPYMKIVCKKIAVQIKEIQNRGYKNFYLVGHSLGAQCAGLIGRHLKEISNNQFVISRIYGLDPAALEFERFYANKFVNFGNIGKTDAEYVQIIHTNGNLYGVKESYGHSDFYPNGGMTQPGCLLNACSHTYAWEAFAESISDETKFLARKCDSYENFKRKNCNKNEPAYMGYSSNKTLPMGKFYLNTKEPSFFHEVGRKVIDGVRSFGTTLVESIGGRTLLYGYNWLKTTFGSSIAKVISVLKN